MFGGSENLKGRYIEAMERWARRTSTARPIPTARTISGCAHIGADYALFVESDRMGHFLYTINKETLDLQRRRGAERKSARR